MALFHNEVPLYLSNVLPRSLASNAGASRPPNLTPRDFFLWGYIRCKGLVPPLPSNITEVRKHIIVAVNTIDRPSGVATRGLDGALHRGPQAEGPSEPDQQTIN